MCELPPAIAVAERHGKIKRAPGLGEPSGASMIGARHGLTRRGSVAALGAALLLPACDGRVESRTTSLTEVVKAALPPILTITVEPAGTDPATAKGQFQRITHGSGTVINQDGLILTAAHVVARAGFVLVRTLTGDIGRARVVALDPALDLALLSAEIEAPPPIPMAAQLPEPGASIAAVGAPYGFDHSLSTGVVSARNRGRRASGAGLHLQHTAAINPGNSGGPLLDARGDLVGVNVAIPDGQFEFSGIGFAVDSRVSGRFVDAAARPDGYLCPSYGLSLRPVDAKLAAGVGAFALDKALVMGVREESPAERAGLRVGDVVLQRSGRDVSFASLTRALLTHYEAAPTALQVMRAGEGRTVSMTPDLQPPAWDRPEETARPDPGWQLATEGSDVVIAAVVEDGWAARQGLSEGDRIVSVNLQSVTSPAEVAGSLARSPRYSAVLVKRAGLGARMLVLGDSQRRATRWHGNRTAADVLEL